MRIIFLCFLCNLIVAVVPAIAQDQCPCGPKPDLKKAWTDSSVIFTGQVVKSGKSVFKPGLVEVTFQPQTIYKGLEEIRGGQIIVYTKPTESECGYDFAQGMDYVVYASGLPAFLQTSNCGRTVVLELGTQEVAGLRELFLANKK